MLHFLVKRFPWKPQNNADPQHCYSPPANSSLNSGSWDATSATGFRTKFGHSARLHDDANYAPIGRGNKMKGKQSVLPGDAWTKPCDEYSVNDSFQSLALHAHPLWRCYRFPEQYLSSRLRDKGGYHSGASPHCSHLSVSSPKLWLPFLDAITEVYSALGWVCGCRCQMAPACWWISCLLALWCVSGMMSLAPSAKTLLGFSPSPAPVRMRKPLPIFHHLMWQGLHTVHASVGSSHHIWCCCCQCQGFETSSKVLSKLCCRLFLHSEAGIPAV